MLQSFNSHQSVFDIHTPLCLHFPLLGAGHIVRSWHGYRLAQVESSCAVCIKNLEGSLKIKKIGN